MNKIILTAALFFGISVTCYCQSDLTGSWRRVKPYLKNQDFKNKKLQQDDLEINSDSTFHIQGNATNLNSRIPGWDISEDYKGTWQQKGVDYLTFWIEPKQNKLFVNFKIISLTADKLVLRFLPESNTDQDITYLHL
ncbi:MAG: hypothetical protein QM737_15925 [Ferruginibacter sp.]